MRLTVDDVNAAEAAIAAADVLLLQLESPLSVVERAAALAADHGVTVILNPAPAQTLPLSLLSRVDILIPNETETSLLTGLPLSTPIEQAAEALFELGVGRIIMTLGERGAMYIDQSGQELVPAFEITPVDTTAAGDAFVGGFAVALAEKQPPTEAVRWGNAAGALAATKLGAQPSLPDRAALTALLGGQAK
jgi:ribokinase